MTPAGRPIDHPGQVVELGCWQPKRTGKGDGIVITAARVNLLRVNKTVQADEDAEPLQSRTLLP